MKNCYKKKSEKIGKPMERSHERIKRTIPILRHREGAAVGNRSQLPKSAVRQTRRADGSAKESISMYSHTQWKPPVISTDGFWDTQ